MNRWKNIVYSVIKSIFVFVFVFFFWLFAFKNVEVLLNMNKISMELLGEYKSSLKIPAFCELLDLQSVKMKSCKKDRSSLTLCVTGWTIFFFFLASQR